MRGPARAISVDQFRAEVKADSEKVGGKEKVQFRCPMCRCDQSAEDLIAAGDGASLADVERFLAFSCVGRWQAAGSPRAEADGKPCNWTLGGLFTWSDLVVETPDGEKHPRFELTSKCLEQVHG
jgi:hypothetical protein